MYKIINNTDRTTDRNIIIEISGRGFILFAILSFFYERDNLPGISLGLAIKYVKRLAYMPQTSSRRMPDCRQKHDRRQAVRVAVMQIGVHQTELDANNIKRDDAIRSNEHLVGQVTDNQRIITRMMLRSSIWLQMLRWKQKGLIRRLTQ